ncbi:mRNA-capping enzyme subunit beta [Malassezia furfur]|uniref:mRNA-capping enzyme subunit beta n=1 Tax=Malassezia furfur TaxID=55194 RepID=A0ABY8EUG4_MALFU|nr:CET1 [Malassezia furfur]WFD49182.1 mRNA-capping enzyme subunit beta [Malassezia furfur]
MDDAAVPQARSVFGVDPLDEFALLVSDCVWDHCRNLGNIEIEAKIGVLIDRGTQSRLRLPVFTETIVDAKQLNLRFESNMSMAQHRHFNQLLNQAVAFSAQAAPPDRITYRHQKEIDSFYDERDPDTGHMVHMRVTRDAVTHEVKPGGIVAKKRIADINVFAPNRPFDYRISINTETPVPAPQDGTEPSFVREKDRLSYTHQNMNIDLTQVILPNKPKEPVHELEVEIRNSADLMQHAYLSRSQTQSGTQEWTPFEDTILVLLNNVRLLIRNAAPPQPPVA